MLTRWHKQYGPVVGYYFGMKPVVICADPEHLKTILLKEFHNFADRSVSSKISMADHRGRGSFHLIAEAVIIWQYQSIGSS